MSQLSELDQIFIQQLDSGELHHSKKKIYLSLFRIITLQLAATEKQHAKLLNLIVNTNRVYLDFDECAYFNVVFGFRVISSKNMKKLLDSYLAFYKRKISLDTTNAIYIPKHCWSLILMNKQKYLDLSYNNLQTKIRGGHQRLLRHYRYTYKLLKIIDRAYSKRCVLQLRNELPFDVLWVIIKYLSR